MSGIAPSPGTFILGTKPKAIFRNDIEFLRKDVQHVGPKKQQKPKWDNFISQEPKKEVQNSLYHQLF